MADRSEVILTFCPGGMNAALDPALLDNSQYHKGVNVALDHQLPKTRRGVRVVTLIGDESAIEAVSTLNFQGAHLFNPARGMGNQIFGGLTEARIVVAAGGRKFSLRIEDRADGTFADVQDITGDDGEQDSGHLVWMEQAESYLVAGDGVGNTWIYDRENGGRHSRGFLNDDPDSEVPTGVRAPIYLHGRLWVVVNARQIVAGDILHGQNQTNPSDVLRFTEQGYWAEGQYFLPPSSMGDVIASAPLPLRDTAHGHGELMFHTVDGGIFSINGNVYPRSEWANTPMVRHALLDTAATGPYALDIHDGDQIFRSRYGIQTLRSARAESQLVGRPNKPISEEVALWLEADHVPYLRFASLVHWTTEERLLCTMGPQVEGLHRFHMGLVTCDFDPMDSRQAVRAWEGLWTFPAEICHPVQMVNGLFGDSERTFAFHRGADGRYRLVEYGVEDHDVLSDGTESRVLCHVETGDHVVTGNHLLSRHVTGGEVYFTDVRGDLDYSVYVKSEREEWMLWEEGTVTANDKCVQGCDESGKWDLRPYRGEDYVVRMGRVPQNYEARRWRFAVRWRGVAKLEGIQGYFEPFTPDQHRRLPNPSARNIRETCSLGDFDYCS